MYRKLGLREFLDTVLDHARRGMRGVFFLIGDDDGWGKLRLHDAQGFLLEYRKEKGKGALKHIQALQEVLFYFQPPRLSDHSRPGMGEADGYISGRDFFFHFDLHTDELWSAAGLSVPQPEVGEGVRPAWGARGLGKVLVVDDSALARKAARYALEAAGYQVVEAWDGFEALGRMQNESPDLVLLDLIMPGLDGYKVLELIRANKRQRDVPVVILTGRDSLMDKLKGRFSGTNEYLTKPFKPQQLLEVVQRLIPSPPSR